MTDWNEAKRYALYGVWCAGIVCAIWGGWVTAIAISDAINVVMPPDLQRKLNWGIIMLVLGYFVALITAQVIDI